MALIVVVHICAIIGFIRSLRSYQDFSLCSICLWHTTYILDGSDSENIVKFMLG